jgi:hypothetical protein
MESFPILAMPFCGNIAGDTKGSEIVSNEVRPCVGKVLIEEKGAGRGGVSVYMNGLDTAFPKRVTCRSEGVSLNLLKFNLGVSEIDMQLGDMPLLCRQGK